MLRSLNGKARGDHVRVGPIIMGSDRKFMVIQKNTITYTLVGLFTHSTVCIDCTLGFWYPHIPRAY